MNTNLHVGRLAQSLLAILFAGSGLVACTTQEAPPSGTAGTSGGAGITGGAGTTGAGGSSGLPSNDGVVCKPPAQAITDFTYDPDAGATDQVRFGVFGTSLSGGQSAYGSLTGNVTGNDWHLMGNITDYSGFNLYFDNVENCNRVDASAFGGISFTIWGTASGNMLTLGMGTLDNTVKSSWLDSIDAGSGMVKPGRCMPTSGNGPYYHPGCADPTYTFAVTGTQASPQTVSVRWNAFMAGEPMVGVTPANILSVYWNVPWMPGGTPYMVDIHIDNLTFIP
jgi:hypothetical protein